MNRKPDSLLYFAALAALVIVGIITTSIINAIKTNNAGTDIRAKAGVTSTLKFSGVVSQINDVDGSIVIDNMQLSAESRSGSAVDYGTWTVTPPRTFVAGSAPPGTRVSFTVSSDKFDVSSKHATAAEMTVVR